MVDMLRFALDRSPGGGTPASLGSATTNASGEASLGSVGTSGWEEGVYTLTVSFAGSPSTGTQTCLPSSDEATLTVAPPGDSASGGGWYTLAGSGRVNFGFTVKKSDPDCTAECEYSGKFLLINNGKWRIKGELASFAQTGTGPVNGASDGTGELFRWDEAASGGLGDSVSSQPGARFTISFTDGGKATKKSEYPDSFGIQIKVSVPSGLPGPPSGTPMELKSGNISIKDAEGAPSEPKPTPTPKPTKPPKEK
jgi:hypothetical protein